ncbi:MAG: tetratricopeptide repeat protein [Acidimicrobiia bacterium]|nr:tetratricopeptide repeat protein [Acidimicrobiia bacterium]
MNGRWTFAAAYAGSGAAGLIYQVVWTRLLSTYLGHTVAAAGTVLAAFMGGLAVGALVAGRRTRGLAPHRALSLYAAVEVFVAVCALALPLALQATAPLLALAYGESPGAAFGVARLAAALLLVFLPAAAMGATYPIVVVAAGAASSSGRRDADASHAGRLYALNTAGAALGATLAGFVLIPAVGLTRTTLIGAVLNVAAATVAWSLARAERAALMPESRPQALAPGAKRKAPAAMPPARASRSKHQAPPTSEGATPAWIAGAIASLSGLAALIYEVAFTRALALVLGPTSYAFAAMLAAFITGMAIGAALAARPVRHVFAAKTMVPWALVAAAASAAAAAWFTGSRLPLIMATAVADAAGGAATVLTLASLYAAGVLLPLGIALGAVFPLCLVLASRNGELSDGQAAWLYGINTVGAIVGSLAAAFLLVPTLGVRQTLNLGATVSLVAAALVPIGRTRMRPAPLAAIAVVGMSLVALPAWDTNLLTAGGYKYATDVRDLNLDLGVGLRAGRLEYFREGAAGAVSVRRLAGTLAMAIDGKVDASNGPDMVTQKLLAHLPLLLHDDPEEVCIIGLGSGVTLGAALTHSISRADIVEISPEVVEASALFAADNHRALEDPRTHLIVGDGRSHLRYSSRTYDVIISEPSNPWMMGNAALFTREFFEDIRDRLKPEGLVCQWAHTYDLSPDDVRSIAATFTSVFPGAAMWLVGRGDVLLVATRNGSAPNLDAMRHGWLRKKAADDLATTDIHDPFSVMSLYLTGGERLRTEAGAATIETDDRPSLEFTAPVGLYERRDAAGLPPLTRLTDEAAPAVVRDVLAKAGSVEWRNRGRLQLRVRDYDAAFDDFARAAVLDPEDPLTIDGLIESAGAAQRAGEARTLLEGALTKRPSSGHVRVALARLLAAMGQPREAVAHAEAALRDTPGDPHRLAVLASILADEGDVDRLQPLVAQMRTSAPERDETWYYAAMLSFLRGDAAGTVPLAERATQLNPAHAPAWNLMGSASASLGQRDRARHAFTQSLQADPREPTTYSNLGRLALESGDAPAALGYFQEALSLDPLDPTAKDGLSQLIASSR